MVLLKHKADHVSISKYFWVTNMRKVMGTKLSPPGVLTPITECGPKVHKEPALSQVDEYKPSVFSFYLGVFVT